MFLKIFSTLRRMNPTYIPLGRWCRTDKPLNDVKVDLANMDHCGTCNHDNIKETPIARELKKKTRFA